VKPYPINQSPLYKLESRRRLAELLDLTRGELETLANGGVRGYSFFDKKPKNGKKKRHVEQPHLPLRKIQRSLTRLLGRMAPPPYLHSAFRKRSYITNAAVHSYSKKSAKIDIKSFFQAADSSRVACAFRDQFNCSGDVAAVLTKLTTILGHIPTGGNSSTMISFWAYKPMFDEIYTLAIGSGIEMTCCVDDMTFTGEKATPGFINLVRLIVRRFGLKTHKEHHFRANSPKVITGIAITSNGQRLPNARRRLLHEAFDEVISESDLKANVKKAESLLGRATEAEQVEPGFRAEVFLATKMLKDAKVALRQSGILCAATR
jgi:hypothetical protein